MQRILPKSFPSRECLPSRAALVTTNDMERLTFFGAPYGTRTRVTAVKGRCPGPLDEGR
jgi:hypothetical protein